MNVSYFNTGVNSNVYQMMLSHVALDPTSKGSYIAISQFYIIMVCYFAIKFNIPDP